MQNTEKLGWHRPPHSSDCKGSVCSAGDLGSTPGSGRSPGEGNGHPLQHSCLESPMDGGTWRAIVRGAAKIQTRLSDSHTAALTVLQRAAAPSQASLLPRSDPSE